MNRQILKVANYIADQIYPLSVDDNPYLMEQHQGIQLAVARLLDILLLNAGIMVASYFISTSLSILSLIMTGTGSYFIYSMIRKIYVDIRTTGTAVQKSQAEDEFNKIIGLLGSTCYKYSIVCLSHLQSLTEHR